MNIEELEKKYFMTDADWTGLIAEVEELTNGFKKLIHLDTLNDEDILIKYEKTKIIHDLHFLSKKFLIKYIELKEDVFMLK